MANGDMQFTATFSYSEDPTQYDEDLVYGFPAGSWLLAFDIAQRHQVKWLYQYPRLTLICLSRVG